MTPPYDVRVSDHGSVLLVSPISREAESWVEAHLPEEAVRFGLSIVVEPRYLDDLLRGMRADGLTVRAVGTWPALVLAAVEKERSHD